MKAVWFSLFLLCMAATAQADVGWNPEWGCSADGSGCEGEDGVETAGGNESTAARMESCTSGFGCEKCVLTQPYWVPTCGTEPGESGSCKCKVDSGSGSGCKLEGKCTYRR
jgi:hypothetical protein